MNEPEYKPGDQVAYIPTFVWASRGFDPTHKDAKLGFVTSMQGLNAAWCRFWEQGKPGTPCAQDELVPTMYLVRCESVDQHVIIDWFQAQKGGIRGS